MTMSWPSRNIRQTIDIGAAQRRVQKYFVDGIGRRAAAAVRHRRRDDGDDTPGHLPRDDGAEAEADPRGAGAGSSSGSIATSLLLDAMRMTFANGDTKLMTFEDVVPNAPLAAGTFARPLAIREPAGLSRRRGRSGHAPHRTSPSDVRAARREVVLVQVVRRHPSCAACGAGRAAGTAALRRSTSRSHCQQALPALAGSAPSGARSRSTARRTARRRAPAPRAGGACRSAPSAAPAASGRISSKYAVPGSGVRIVNPA